MKNHWKLLVWATIVIVPISCAVIEKAAPVDYRPTYDRNDLHNTQLAGINYG